MIVTIGKGKEQSFDLAAFAIGKQHLEAARAEVRHALHQHIDLMERLAPQ
jgi:hypothetical protein